MPDSAPQPGLDVSNETDQVEAHDQNKQTTKLSISAQLTSKAAETAGNAVTRTAKTAAAGAGRTFETFQALTATDISETVNKLVAAAAAGPVTIYDKAMDANYLNELLRPELGGSYHRLFDGGHTITGAAKAVHRASPDDTIVEEALGAVQALLKDMSTPRGLPVVTWDKTAFDTAAAFLNNKFSIPKSWLYEINTYDAADLLGATTSVAAVLYGWGRADTETFARLAAATATSALISSNPLLLLVAAAASARAYDKARKAGEHAEMADGALKGTAGTTATLASIAAVSAPADLHRSCSQSDSQLRY